MLLMIGPLRLHETSPTTLALWSIVVANGVFGLKLASAHATQSLALYADALESIVNVVTAVVAYSAVRLAARPPDRHHQFGHHKAEYLAAVIEGVLIVLAAIAILRAAYQAHYAPPILVLSLFGIGLNVLATLLNAGWAYVLVARGRRLRSPALAADGWHLISDVVSSVVVLAGLAIVAVTGVAKLDLAMAAAVAIYILWAGARLLRSSMSGLMDEAVTTDVAETIQKAIAENASGALQAHDIRTRLAGPVTYIAFHLVVPGRMSVQASHDICDRIEAALAARIPDCRVFIHVEPEGEAQVDGALVVER